MFALENQILLNQTTISFRSNRKSSRRIHTPPAFIDAGEHHPTVNAEPLPESANQQVFQYERSR